jgi:LAO/AO transport system kinase
MYETINEELKNRFYHSTQVSTMIKWIEHEVTHNKLSSFAAAQKLIDVYFEKNGNK